jgi:hypothetical protein
VPPLRIFCVVCWAGLMGNALSALHSPVANPYVVGIVAFNTADVYLLISALVLIASAYPLALYVHRLRRPAAVS